MTFNDDTYNIISEIGQGACGVVYKAVHKRLNKFVVIKQIKQNGAGIVPSRNEADIIKGLRHSYIPQVYDILEQNGETFIVMDFVDGTDFKKLISGGTRFTKKQLLKYFIQLCEAVDYLHSQKPPVIHSDIKPENIMLTSGNYICLIDFNVSLAFDAEKQAIGGTRGYAPPEQFGIPLYDIKHKNGDLQIGKSRPYVDMRSDIYSIGAAMYFILSGERPDLNYNTKPLVEIAPEVSDGLLHIIHKAMSLEPSKRYKSVKEMQAALRNVNKLDKRYVSLKIRREAITAVSVLAIVGGIFLNRQGSGVMEQERYEKYCTYLTQIESYIDNAEYENAQSLVLEAEKLMPNSLETVYYNEKILFSQQLYKDCLDYVQTALSAKKSADSSDNDELMADIFILGAESAFELAAADDNNSGEYYRSAIELYEKALFYNESIPECYRNIVIAYARIQNVDKAAQMLTLAEANGVTNDELSMLKGEIAWARGEYESAYSCFETALELTENDEIRYRVILAADKMTRDDRNTLSSSKSTMLQMLQTQSDVIAERYSRVTDEMLAYYYVQHGEQTENTEYYYEAAKIYDKLLKDNKLSYTLQKNYFNILFSKLGAFERCLELLDYMSNQGGDYWVSMNYSYTYIAIEQQKDVTEQDYAKAYECYLSALEMYSGSGDPDMDTLGASIDTLISFGLIRR